MRFSVPLLLLLTMVLVSSCSTLKGWFTAQGQKVAQGQELADRGRPLEASVLAEEALVLEPRYREAQELLAKTFAAGQEQFRTQTSADEAGSDPARWDRLVALYRAQQALADRGPTLAPVLDPATGLVLDLTVTPVRQSLDRASLGASTYHWGLGRELLAQGPGPRQARRALAEGKIAAHFDPADSGVGPWLEEVRALATQKLLVVPFFWDGGWQSGGSASQLGSLISRSLVEAPGLPELTTVFTSDRLVTLPGGGPARAGLVSQPDALVLAAAAGQNLVLLGQVTRAITREPQSTVTKTKRERQVLVVDPGHPAGVTETYTAAVTVTEITASVELSASFAVVEVATGADVLTSVKDAVVRNRAVITTFTGDSRALTPEDQAALAHPDTPVTTVALQSQALSALASQVCEAVREALRP